MGLSCFRAISGLDGFGMGWDWDWDLCAGLLYEHRFAMLIRNTISSQVSDRAQLPGVIIYIVDHFGNYSISGGHTCTILCHPTVQGPTVRDPTVWSPIRLGPLEYTKGHYILLLLPFHEFCAF